MTYLPSMQQLRFLTALAEHGHFGRAAGACAVTQSTLSAGIQELESRLGATLVERGRRRLLLTPAGEEVLTRARRLLRDAADLVEAAQGARVPLAGPLRLGVIPTIGPYLVPEIVKGLAARFPALRLYLREEQTAALLERLGAGQIDLALIALPYDTDAFETMVLGEDEILAALPRAHPLARLERVDRDGLAGENLLLMEDGHCLRSHALEACRLVGPVRNEVFQGTSLRTVVQMAENGLGLTLVPRMAVAAELGDGSRLVARPLEPGHPSRRIALAWRPTSPRKDEFRAFGEYVRSALSVLAAPPVASPPRETPGPKPGGPA
jgi:LysR family hydrogen peroxide-inducible transcriptional activator